jgi:hypothetical protein
MQSEEDSVAALGWVLVECLLHLQNNVIEHAQIAIISTTNSQKSCVDVISGTPADLIY